MNIKFKLIIFFVVIMLILLVLRLLAGPNENQASADEIVTIDQKALKVSLSDGLRAADVGSHSLYSLKVSNNSEQNFGSIRIYGCLGLPAKETNVSQTVFPQWLTPKTIQKYSDQNYFNYVVPMPAHGNAAVKLPLSVRKFQKNQNALYSQVFVQLIYPRNSWNIFQINPMTYGPIIASVEDMTYLN